MAHDKSNDKPVSKKANSYSSKQDKRKSVGKKADGAETRGRIETKKGTPSGSKVKPKAAKKKADTPKVSGPAEPKKATDQFAKVETGKTTIEHEQNDISQHDVEEIEKSHERQEDEAPLQSNQAQKPPKSGRGLASLALFVSLLALAAGGYALMQIMQDQATEGSQAADIEDRLGLIATEQESFTSGIRVDQQNLVAKIDALSSKTDDLGESVNTEIQRIGKQLSLTEEAVQSLQAGPIVPIDEVKAGLGESVARWKYDEVRSLLSQVNHYFGFTGDAQQARAGLMLAQSTLATISDLQIEPVKSALAEDISLLDAQQSVDVSGIRSQLSGLIESVPSLALISDTQRDTVLVGDNDSTEQAEVGEPESDSKSEGLLSFGKVLLSDIGGLVKHKRLDEPLLPSLDNATRFVLYESLRLKLEGAIIALLRRDNETYQAQLALAAEQLNTNFETVTAEAKGITETLASLQTGNIGLNAPNISSALDALNRIMSVGN